MKPSEDQRLPEGQSETAVEDSPLVSCFWCGGLHAGEHPLSVCPTCTASFSTVGSPATNGTSSLGRDSRDVNHPGSSSH
jgi:hypothetical protein